MNSNLPKAALFAAAAFVALAGVADASPRERSGRAEVHTNRGPIVAERQVSRERGAAARETTITGPGGRTRSVEESRTRTGRGAWEAERTVTQRNGETRSQSGAFAVSRTDTGRSVTGVIETENRGTVDYRKDVTRTEDGRTISASGAFADGTSISRTATTDCDKGIGCTTSGSFTNRAGDTSTFVDTRNKTETGWEAARDVTFADGKTRSVDVEGTRTGDKQGVFDRTVTGRNGETRTVSGSYARGQ
jgi:hypothetical protein